MAPRVLIIGLDGGALDLIHPWAEQGELPNLARMMAEGAYGSLASTIHPITAAAWASFMTGMNQGKHGLYDFVQRIPGSYNFELTNAAIIAAPTLFEIASHYSRRVIALNVPLTFPPRPVNGVMVSGLFAQPAPDIAYPKGLYEEIVKLVNGEYIILPRYNRWASDPLGDYVDQLHRAIDQRRHVAEFLMTRNWWDLCCVVFTATDLVQHTFWKYMEDGDARFGDAILDVYRRVDAAIGTLQKVAESTGEDVMTLIMSDHGAGYLESFVQLNRWLADEGLLHFLPKRKGIQAWLVKQAWQLYRCFVPPFIIGKIRARVGVRYDRMRDKMESSLFATRIDWPHTRAYSLGACGNIFLNVAGREPQGIVQPGAEYEALRDDISERLMSLTDPDAPGRAPLVERVYRREELYEGPFLEQAADLIIRWRDYRYWGRGRYDFDTPQVFYRQQQWDFSKLPLSGTHRPNGILIVAGANIRPVGVLDSARIIDVAPTVLAALGVPVPSEMDGRVLVDIFRESPALAGETGGPVWADVSLVQGYSEEEAAEIEERLKALGYM